MTKIFTLIGEMSDFKGGISLNADCAGKCENGMFHVL